jgi:chorismate mutase
MPAFLERVGQAMSNVVRSPSARRPASNGASAKSTNGTAFGASKTDDALVDLQRRRDQLKARVAELQWDLGGLVYEMAIRDRIRVDVIVRRAAELQNADAELNEVERILRLEQTATAGECASCGAPHSTGAAYCWQCGQPLLQEVASDTISAP